MKNRAKPSAGAVDYLSTHQPDENETRCASHGTPSCSVCNYKPRSVTSQQQFTPKPTTQLPSLRILRREGLRSVPQPEPTTILGEKETCPHGHIIVNGKPYCKVCLKATWTAATFAEFLDEVIPMCDGVAQKLRHRVVSREDRANQAFLAVLSKIDVIAGARQPGAMAWTIAENAVRDLLRKKYWTESQIQLYPTDDGDIESDEDAFERVRKKDTIVAAPERAIRFSRGDVKLMANLFTEAFERISPEQAFHIRARYGFYAESGKVTLDSLASLKNRTVDQIRYSISQGLKHLMTEMLALLEERKRARPSRSRRRT